MTHTVLLHKTVNNEFYPAVSVYLPDIVLIQVQKLLIGAKDFCLFAFGFTCLRLYSMYSCCGEGVYMHAGIAQYVCVSLSVCVDVQACIYSIR